VYRFHALLAQRWRRERVFLLGDACHQTPPFLGQGMCAGIRDAGNLAWKLAMVLRDGAPEALLDSYEQERKPHVRALVATAKRFGEIIGELDPEAARIRDETLRGQLERGEAETIRQRFSDLAAGSSTGPGARGSLSVQPRSRGRLAAIPSTIYSGSVFVATTIDPNLATPARSSVGGCARAGRHRRAGARPACRERWPHLTDRRVVRHGWRSMGAAVMVRPTATCSAPERCDAAESPGGDVARQISEAAQTHPASQCVNSGPPAP
jgi:hypothetical protein